MNSNSQVSYMDSIDVKRLISLIMETTVRLCGTENFTAYQCVDALSQYYAYTAAIIRQVIARNPHYTMSMKAGPLMTILTMELPRLHDITQISMLHDLQNQSLEATGTQTISPPEPPRPASDDKRDFDRPNAPPRPTTDRDDPSGLMTSDQYQQLALRTESIPGALFLMEYDAIRTVNERQNHNTYTRLLHGLLGVGSESGELQDAMKKFLFYGKPIDLVNIMEECGDLLWYIAVILHACGYSLSYCMEKNIAKLQKRYPEKFTSENALNRDLESERKALTSDPEPCVCQQPDLYDPSKEDQCPEASEPQGLKGFPEGTIGSELKFDPTTGTSYDVHKSISGV